MKRFQRKAALLLAVLTMLTPLSACSTAEEGGAEAPASSTEQPASSEGKERISLTFWTGLGNKVAEQANSWDEIACWPYIMDKFQVDIEFIHPPLGQETENFNLMLSSKTLPDIIQSNWRTFQGGGATKAIKDGIILDLSDKMEEYAPNFMALMEEHPDWNRDAVTDDGVYYYFPYIYQTRLANSFVGFQIRQDWLDKLDLDMPETIEDWHTVLTAFKTQDPNGNGEADEIPFLPSKSHNPNQSLSSLAYFRLAYGLSAHFNGFFLDEDKNVQYTYLQPEYRDYLETMRDWYAEGLIDPEYVTSDNKVLTAKMTSNQVGATYAGYGMGFLGNWTNVMWNEKGETDYLLVGTPFPTLNGGTPNGYSDPFVTDGGAAVSTSCQYPERAMELLDYLYSPEGHYVINFGPDETVYSMVDGKPQYKIEEISEQNPGLPIDSVLIQYGMACQGGPFVQDEAYSEMVAETYPGQTIAAQNYINSSIDWMIPSISPSTEESSELSSIINDANTLMGEFETKVIMGIEPIENLDQMIETLKSMNIDRAIEIEQAAVERYYQR